MKISIMGLFATFSIKWHLGKWHSAHIELRINGTQRYNNQQFCCVLHYNYCDVKCHYAEWWHAECHYAECHYTECHYAECHYAECHYAECHYAECDFAECHYAECHYAECHYAKCHYAACHYAECHYVECRCAKFYPAVLRVFLRQLSEMKKSKNFLEKLWLMIYNFLMETGTSPIRYLSFKIAVLKVRPVANDIKLYEFS